MHVQSQPLPSETPQVYSQIKTDDAIHHQKPSAQNNKITDTPMTGVSRVVTKIENRETEINKEKREEQGTEFYPTFFGIRVKITDSLLVLFTGVLAGFTYCLYRSTEKLWKAGEKQMQLTRDSLTLAREEFISTHRPRLIVRDIAIKPHTDPMIPIEYGKPIQVEWVVVNVGATVAEIIESNATILTAKTFRVLTPPNSFTHNSLTNNTKNGIKLAPGSMEIFCTTSDVIFENVGQHSYLTHGEIFIFFFGFIKYKDATGNVRHTAFCRRYDAKAERFIIVHDPDYEYND